MNAQHLWQTTIERLEEQSPATACALLDEALPPTISPLERDGGLYNYWRLHTVHLLNEWKHDDIVTVLRRALLNAWKLEEAEQPEIKDIWYPYQDTLTYALGSLEVFGALTNIILPIAHLHRWTVTLVCGSLQARQRHGDLLSQIQTNDALKSDIAQVLHRRFGLSETEQKAFIDGYADAYFAPR